mmetsp:Transcript_8311/g.14243  ORF Transcript_8311/g.14243 Transcript_8311/m.14243 type:complete len:213 (-) Transcript_8311:310-948(-)
MGQPEVLQRQRDGQGGLGTVRQQEGQERHQTSHTGRVVAFWTGALGGRLAEAVVLKELAVVHLSIRVLVGRLEHVLDVRRQVHVSIVALLLHDGLREHLGHLQVEGAHPLLQDLVVVNALGSAVQLALLAKNVDLGIDDLVFGPPDDGVRVWLRWRHVVSHGAIVALDQVRSVIPVHWHREGVADEHAPQGARQPVAKTQSRVRSHDRGRIL